MCKYGKWKSIDALDPPLLLLVSCINNERATLSYSSIVSEAICDESFALFKSGERSTFR